MLLLLQVTVDTPHSPCGSTTASSEIEILDHESSISETSAGLLLGVFYGFDYQMIAGVFKSNVLDTLSITKQEQLKNFLSAE